GSGTIKNAQQYNSQLRQQQAALASAQATLKLSERQIEALKAQRNSAVASLAQAKAQRDQAQLNLSYTRGTAAQPGRVVLFTLSSVLCGFAPNLQALLLFRVLQGFGGGGMVPVAQSILADSFPPEKRGQAFALFGVAVVVAPVVGPTLGGWIS